MAIEHVNESNFEEKVLRAEFPVIVDFHAEWCGPCRMLEPELVALSKERPDLVFTEVDVDESPALAARFGIDSIPAVLFFKNGTLAGRSVGYCHKNDLIRILGA